MDSIANSIVNVIKNGDVSLYNKTLMLRTIAIIAIVLFVFTYIFPTNYAYVITLIAFALWVGSNYVRYTETQVDTKNHQIMYHLNVLQEIINMYIDKQLNKDTIASSKLTNKEINMIYDKNILSSMYIDSNLIEFLYSIKQLSEWNDNEFYLLVKGTNNILRLRKEIEIYHEQNNMYPDNIFQMTENALQLRTNTINNMHNFIYSIPKANIIYTYLDKIIHRYMVLISRNTDKMYYYTKEHIKKVGINTDTKFINYNNIRAYDPDSVQFFT